MNKLKEVEGDNMDKYDILKSKNSYINYTLKNYLNCRDDLGEEELPRFTQLFDLMKDHEISIGNILVDNKAIQGVKLRESTPKKIVRDTSDLSQQLSIISNNIDANDKMDILFFQSITHLCDSMQYLSTEEMMDLNDLFQNVNNFRQSISEDIIKDGKSFFYPYDRYPKRNIK